MKVRATYQCWGCGSEKVKYEKAKEGEEFIPSKVVWNLCPDCLKRKEVIKDEKENVQGSNRNDAGFGVGGYSSDTSIRCN